MSIRILLADESSTIKKAFEIGLNSYGAEIKNVQHGIDVIEVAETFKPDLIFADVLISKMNGYEVCSQIKNHPRLHYIPVVLMWSGFMDIDEDKYITCQADGKIEKPFSADQLIELIQGLIENNPASIKAHAESTKKSEMLTPPGIGALPKATSSGARTDSIVNPVIKRQVNPAEALLFKEDMKVESNSLDDYSSETKSDADTEDFNLDGFEAFDLQDNQNDNSNPYGLKSNDFNSELESDDLDDGNKFDTSFLDINDDENMKEITSIPTAEQEQILFNKLKEDTAIRHGSGFLDQELKDELSSNSFEDSKDLLDSMNMDSLDSDHNLVDLSEDLDDLDSLDLDSSLDQDIYGQDLTSKTTEVDNVFTNPEKDLHDSKTIHRDVNDLHNSDAGFSPSTVDSNPKVAAIGQLTKEEIKSIISEQAKDVIQSIVWELVPELSKQMIEKEIKRLMADAVDDSKPNSF